MAGRLARWTALPLRERMRVIGCAVGLPLIHASLAILGYRRTRRMVEHLSHRRARRTADACDIADARALARAADIAGHHGAVHATCLRQSLLVYGALRCKRLDPVLQLGVRPSSRAFEAHAWVELEGQHLLPVDAGHQPFVAPGARMDPG